MGSERVDVLFGQQLGVAVTVLVSRVCLRRWPGRGVCVGTFWRCGWALASTAIYLRANVSLKRKGALSAPKLLHSLQGGAIKHHCGMACDTTSWRVFVRFVSCWDPVSILLQNLTYCSVCYMYPSLRCL
jgi:hypothetical protein